MKKTIATILSLIMIFSLFSVCGATAFADEGGYQINTDLDLETEITLDIVGPGLFEHGEEGTTDLVSGLFIPGWNAIEERWNELYPNVKLNFNICPWSDWQASITTACLDGQADIIMHGASLPDLTEDLGPYLEADPDFTSQIMALASRRTAEHPSEYKVSGISVYTAPIIMWLDTEKFEHFGVDLPADDWTIDDLIDIASKLTGTDPVTGEECYGIKLPFTGQGNIFFNHMWFAYGTGAKIFNYGDTMADSSVDYTSEQSVKAFQIIADLAQYESPESKEGVAITDTIDGSNDWAMWGTNFAISSVLEMKAAGIEEGRYVAYNMPVISEGEHAGKPMPYFGDINIAMYNQSDAKEWVWEFIKFMNTDDVALQWVADQLVYPNNIKAAEKLESILDERTLSCYEYAMANLPDENFNGSTNDNFNNVSFGPVTATLTTAVDDVINGRITAEEAAQTMQDTVDEYLATVS